MAHFRGNNSAFGAPGDEPFWTHANKEGVGTAYSIGSRVWFTIWHGILTEVYYPTVDRPQLRDLEFLFSDGAGVFLEEKRDFDYKVERMSPAQGYKIETHDREGRFSFTKEIISAPDRPCVLLHIKIGGDEKFLRTLKTYVLCAPRLEVGGKENNAYVAEVSGRNLLVAEKQNRWLVLGATCGFSKLSCGYVGKSDGYTDISQNRKMNFQFDVAKNGNVALTGELDLSNTREFTVGVSFGESLASAVSCLFQSLGLEYEDQRKIFIDQWRAATHGRKSLESCSGDKGHLFESSYNLLLTHEDDLYRGAFIASLTIPWGEARDDKEGKGGYHLVWTRDMVESAMGLLAAGNTEAPFRALVYLASRQEEDGKFPQNFWVNGEAFWTGMQLDEVAFPVLLARRLHQLNLLHNFDPLVMVNRAVAFLLHSGPVTGEERWEEASGYSPSTLAAIISAFICAASFARTEKNEDKASFLESYADFLKAHIEEWTVTTEGSLLPGTNHYFVRLNPAKPGEVASPGAVNKAALKLTSQPPGAPESYPARNIVDGGFLQLVRYGILSADDPLIVDSLRVVDAVLKADTPFGPCWHRYNHDGYGQKPDGGPYKHWGQGRPWPLLTGERAHYELAAGRDTRYLIRAMEQFSNGTCLLPEQIWDGPDLPQADLHAGGPSGSANPLLWAHSEYVRLLRSCHDGKVFDLIPEVAARYRDHNGTSQFEFWLPKHPISHARKNHTLRICAPESFRLRWTANNWKTWQDSNSQPTGIGGEYFDLAPADLKNQVEFTFYWTNRQQWQGQNYSVGLQ
ncbi:MAG TPA: glycoside hydrolase family 15 protein [Bryobacteraceae bacterium]|nr:glycoside hydrolase family 15 protein [Bryobacteraceae bacterium]